MTDKITLTNLVNLQNETTAVNAINNNNAAIIAAIDNTLSRDGTSPNQMGASLDMNSNRLLNLPAAVSQAEPVTLAQLNTFSGGGTIQSIPTGGTTGQVLTKKSSSNYDADWENGTLAAVSAFTLKGNPTGSSATPTDFLIGSLTGKSPAGTDLIMISDESASHALKQSTVSSMFTGNSVTSIAGNKGAFTLGGGITNSTNQIKLAYSGNLGTGQSNTPTGTSNTTGVMMGLGSIFNITPTNSTRLFVSITGNCASTLTSAVTNKMYYGTGTPPGNGAAVTGTLGSVSQVASIPVNNGSIPFVVNAIITGLTLNTFYWFDINLATSSGVGSINQINFSAFEV